MWYIYMAEVPDSEKNILEKVNEGWLGNVANFFSSIETLLFISMIVVLSAAVILTFFFYTKRINAKSREKINKLIREKKYIRGLFIELNDAKENLRYFLHGDKWKKRIIQDYNNIFNDKYGDLLKEVFGNRDDVSFLLNKNNSINEILKIIENTRLLLNEVHKDNIKYPSKYQESMVLFQIYSNKYDEILLQLKKRAEYIKSNYVILTGSAGNGKTNLLCSTSEMIFNLNYPCVFMNAKEIDSDIEQYFIRQLNFLAMVGRHEKGLAVVEFLIRLRRRPTYIIIDAINENNDKEFCKKLPDFLNRLLDKKYIRVLVTCRSEYFEARYKKILIENIKYIPLCDNIQEQTYSSNAVDRMFDIYSKEFRFNGTLSQIVKSKLSQQLLLMRMFFETHEGVEEAINDLDYYLLYDKYIDKISEQKQVNIREYLDEIAALMTNIHNYAYISEKLISNRGEQIYEKVDGTILVSKTLMHHENSILKNEESVIYFVFDELRDYCIARYNLMKMCKNPDMIPKKEQVMQFLEDLYREEAVCFEGVVNYIYRDFKAREEEELCNEILEKFVKPADIEENGRNYVSNEKLNGWGLRLIFQNSQKRLVCEEEYLKYIIYENPASLLASLFSFLILQEKEQGPYTLEILFNLLQDIHNYKVFANVLDNCVSFRRRDGIHITDFYEIDQELHSVSEEALKRFREFEILFILFFKWEGKRQLIEQIKKDCNINAVKEEIRNKYYFYEEGESDDY